MSFLSLAKGDPAARDLVQRAIRARYGMRPLPVESVRLEMIGQGKGPLGLPAKILVTLRFITDSHWRWDQTRQLFGITLGKSSTSYDSGAVYTRQGSTSSQVNEPAVLQGARRRLWLDVCSLLTPLTMPGVMLKFVEERTFQAMPETQPDDVAEIRLNADDTVDYVRVANCYRDAQQLATLTVRPQDGSQTLNGLSLPKRVAYEWENGDNAREVFAITNAEANPKIPADRIYDELTVQSSRRLRP